jgi:aspartyl-tRNA(Asn)/glutamyl-tRNA(Gln) amidotransferase subunit C
VEHVTVLRPDETAKEYSRVEILSNAPETDGNHFIVPRIV